MHILFLTHYFPPEVNAPANRTYEHVIQWARSGWKITILTNQPNHPSGRLFPGYQNRWTSEEIMDGVRVIRLKTYLTPNKGNVKRTLNFLQYSFLAIWASFFVKKIDAVVATSPQFFCGLAGSVIGKIRNRPFVLEIRDLWPDSIVAVNAMKVGLAIRFLRRLEKAMYSSATRIVTLTDAFKTHVIRMGYPERRVRTVTNGIDLERFRIIEAPEDPIEKSERFIFSYIGTFGMAHNLETVLETAYLLRNEPKIHFLLIGDGAEREKLLRMHKEMQIGNLSILPLQPKRFIPYFLEISNVGLILLKDSPVFRTVIPSKMFEYMGMRKPLLISAPFGEATSIVEKYECGIHVKAEQPELLAEKCRFLFQKRQMSDQMGRSGYQAVRNYFNRDVLAETLRRFLEDMVSERYPG